jgi:hypothetical protein
MISFMISVVPPKIDWTRLSQSSPSRRRAANQRSAGWAGLHLVRAGRGVCVGELGCHHPPGDCLAASQPPEPGRGPDDDAEPAAADIPALDADLDSGELRRGGQ